MAKMMNEVFQYKIGMHIDEYLHFIEGCNEHDHKEAGEEDHEHLTGEHNHT